MSDQQNAVNKIMDFLSDDTKRTLLLEGYDDDAKIRVTLSCLNKSFSKGIIKTGRMSDIPRHINRAFKRKKLPPNVTSSSVYPIGKMNIKINSYVTHTKSNPKGNDNTFTVFFPVQSVLMNDEKYKSFLDEVKDTESKKVIIITTNDQGIKEWDIENHVDEVFFYSVENDNPQIMTNLRNNGAI